MESLYSLNELLKDPEWLADNVCALEMALACLAEFYKDNECPEFADMPSEKSYQVAKHVLERYHRQLKDWQLKDYQR